MSLAEIVANQRFQFKSEIGRGKHSRIFLAKQIHQEYQVAIKMHQIAQNNRLNHQAKIYRLLQGGCKSHSSEGIPHMYWSGIEGDFEMIVMSILGPNLQQLLEFCKRKFSVKTVIMITQQILHRIQFIHNKGIIYRDMKPNNILVGLGKQAHRIYMVDFQHACLYQDQKGHVRPQKTNQEIGHPIFKSIYSHLGLSKIDDQNNQGGMTLNRQDI